MRLPKTIQSWAFCYLWHFCLCHFVHRNSTRRSLRRRRASPSTTTWVCLPMCSTPWT
jgi:hypothetical protein